MSQGFNAYVHNSQCCSPCIILCLVACASLCGAHGFVYVHDSKCCLHVSICAFSICALVRVSPYVGHMHLMFTTFCNSIQHGRLLLDCHLLAPELRFFLCSIHISHMCLVTACDGIVLTICALILSLHFCCSISGCVISSGPFLAALIFLLSISFSSRDAVPAFCPPTNVFCVVTYRCQCHLTCCAVPYANTTIAYLSRIHLWSP